MFDKTALLYGQALGALREEDKGRAQEALHLEAEVDHLERIGDHAVNIAGDVLYAL